MIKKLNTIIIKIKCNQDIEKVLKNSSWLLLDKLIRMGMGLLVGAWVARYLGPSANGELAYAVAFVAFFQPLANLGMDGIVVREITKKIQISNELLGTTFILRLVSGVFCWLVACFTIGFLDGFFSSSFFLVTLVGASLTFQCSDTIDLWFQSQSQSKRTVAAKLCSYAISNIIKIILILQNAPLFIFAIIVALEALLSAIALLIAYKRFPCVERWILVKSRALDLIRESWPFIISSISIVLYMRIDQILIKNILGEEQLGIYAAVLPLSTLWAFIPMTLSVSLTPYITKVYNENREDYLNLLGNIFRFFSFLGWLVCLPIFFLSEEIVNLLFGIEYSTGGSVLQVIIFTNLFINLGVAQSLWILTERKAKLNLYKTFLGLVVCIIANLILIPKLGIQGAAISALLAQLSATVLSNFLFCRNIFFMQLKSIVLLK
ncbi:MULTISPECIES: flippase [Vibrio]|uniref:flippase n=1 Tax=Vibrio TaxID=662 RepID=UPI00107F929E|nr:flippase [Vibrio tasmaniensis]